jgi:hypothetical protein
MARLARGKQGAELVEGEIAIEHGGSIGWKSASHEYRQVPLSLSEKLVKYSLGLLRINDLCSCRS